MTFQPKSIDEIIDDEDIIRKLRKDALRDYQAYERDFKELPAPFMTPACLAVMAYLKKKYRFDEFLSSNE